MSRNESEPGHRGAPVRAGWVVAVALVLVYGVCLVNAGISIGFTRRLAGPRPESLEQRYGELRNRLDGVARVSYISDSTAYFLGARYALVPTVLDISHIDFRKEDRTIVGYHLDAMVDDASFGPPLRVLCEFDDPRGLDAFVDRLTAAASRRGLRVEEMHRVGSMSLLSVGG